MDFSAINFLSKSLEGELLNDDLSRMLYATDASVYRKRPIGVAYPKTETDIQKIIQFANQHNIGLIPRTAGTSLAGQCVGEGLVVDVSRHMTEVIHLDPIRKQVTVQPGVVRDELNRITKAHGLFFGPNTSTSNRCMIGGMVGNNSSGTTSIKYGVTRDKIVALKGFLADGSPVVFEVLDTPAYKTKIEQQDHEGAIYRALDVLFRDPALQQAILNQFPKAGIHRRNTGYALDAIADFEAFGGSGETLNLGKLIAGSEGTLLFITEITLQLDDLPSDQAAMIVAHYKTLEKCLNDVAPVMSADLYLCEMMDKIILDCTKDNRSQMPNRFFIEGDPAAVLMLEVRAPNDNELKIKAQEVMQILEHSANSYAQPVLYGSDIDKAITLRKAGLGLLGNMIGDKKAVACIEDTAVALEDLSEYIGKFTEIMNSYGQRAVYYAHAGAGELHLRPILDLKRSEDVSLFRELTTRVAELVKSYRGSLSGEHGDGIVRAEFIERMVGPLNYEAMQTIKHVFDPKGIMNPGKIIDAYPMDEALRYETDRDEPEIDTFLDFSSDMGILRSAEKCNGSGDCRKSHLMGGAMCPSYQATKTEKDSTRARANALREVLTHSQKTNRFDSEALKEVFDLCLSCKACASECPSNVDVSTLKAEFLHQYQKTHGTTFRDRMFARSADLNRTGSRIAPFVNLLHGSALTAGLAKKLYGISPKRRLPKLSSFNFDKYIQNTHSQKDNTKQVILFIDEFTAYMDVQIGKDAIDLLHGLGYRIQLLQGDSGRALLSKGFLSEAKRSGQALLEQIKGLELNCPIVGIEPSALLTLRDEFLRFGFDPAVTQAIAERSQLIEAFLVDEFEAGRIEQAAFTSAPKTIHVHGHCHQKALADVGSTVAALSLPQNYKVSQIPSGCCGMAGSFGYEKDHYEVSMAIGELVLFPYIRTIGPQEEIAANGTSCRHQIQDGTAQQARHPVSILKDALVVDG